MKQGHVLCCRDHIPVDRMYVHSLLQHTVHNCSFMKAQLITKYTMLGPKKRSFMKQTTLLSQLVDGNSVAMRTRYERVH